MYTKNKNFYDELETILLMILVIAIVLFVLNGPAKTNIQLIFRISILSLSVIGFLVVKYLHHRPKDKT